MLQFYLELWIYCESACVESQTNVFDELEKLLFDTCRCTSDGCGELVVEFKFIKLRSSSTYSKG